MTEQFGKNALFHNNSLHSTTQPAISAKLPKASKSVYLLKICEQGDIFSAEEVATAAH